MNAVDPRDALFAFAQGLALALKSGMPLPKALRALEEAQAASGDVAWRNALAGVRRQVEEGMALSSALQKCGDPFPRMLVGMVRTGEVTSRLQETLQGYVDYLGIERGLVPGARGAHVALWCHRMRLFLTSGMPILQAMEVSVSESVPDHLREAVLILRETIREGQSMGAKMAEFPEVFPEHLCQLVVLGEQSGTLDDALGRAGEYLARRTYDIEPIPFVDLALRPAGPALVERPGGDPAVASAGETAADRLRASVLGLNFVDLTKIRISQEAVGQVTGELARRHALIPVQRLGRRLFVAMADPTDATAIEAVKEATGLQVIAALAPAAQVARAISEYYGVPPRTDQADPSGAEHAHAEAEKAQDTVRAGREHARVDREQARAVALPGKGDEAPVVRIANAIVQQAVKDGASDVHLELSAGIVRVRYRIDGVLHDIMEIPGYVHGPLMHRLKLVAGMAMGQRDRPQRGHIPVEYGGEHYDLRAMTYPFAEGEGMVMRVSAAGGAFARLEDLGMLPEQAETCRRLLRQPCGIVAVAGVYGSGKTATLQTMLRDLLAERGEGTSFATLEDPAEAHLEGVAQVALRPGSGLSAAQALRALMHQDPDVIVVGDVADAETMAEVTHAATTGHLLVVGVHASDAADGLEKLARLDADGAGEMWGVIGQRLLRKVCGECRGAGCEACRHTGCRGRTGVFEILANSPGLLRLLHAGAPRADLLALARDEGMIPLSEAAHRKVVAGVVSEEEAKRVLGG